eukprot:m.201183 g.201183  ORF g.201183 m.201183 type:complete len:61 (-) comp15743_c0_seq10:5779-5961(-)
MRYQVLVLILVATCCFSAGDDTNVVYDATSQSSQFGCIRPSGTIKLAADPCDWVGYYEYN